MAVLYGRVSYETATGKRTETGSGRVTIWKMAPYGGIFKGGAGSAMEIIAIRNDFAGVFRRRLTW